MLSELKELQRLLRPLGFETLATWLYVGAYVYVIVTAFAVPDSRVTVSTLPWLS